MSELFLESPYKEDIIFPQQGEIVIAKHCVGDKPLNPDEIDAERWEKMQSIMTKYRNMRDGITVAD